MTPRERKSLAEQLKANPLWDGIQEEMEANAVERMFAANDDMKRLEAQAYARAVRNFRQDCERLLRNTEAKKPAPA